MKEKKPKLKRRHKGFRLIPHTAGIISNGVYVKDDNSEIKICFAWGKDLIFRPLKDGEVSL